MKAWNDVFKVLEKKVNQELHIKQNQPSQRKMTQNLPVKNEQSNYKMDKRMNRHITTENILMTRKYMKKIECHQPSVKFKLRPQ